MIDQPQTPSPNDGVPADEPEPGSVSQLIHRMRDDEEAVRELWERYSTRLVAWAASKLRSLHHDAAFDEEDVATIAFAAFCRAVRDGRYPQLKNRDQFGRMLHVIASRKAVDLAKRSAADKRGGANDDGLRQEASTVEQMVNQQADEPTPDTTAMMAEECCRLLQVLRDPDLEQVVLWKLEGHTNDEIAEKLGNTRRTVQRMLVLIRATWNRYLKQREQTL